MSKIESEIPQFNTQDDLNEMTHWIKKSPPKRVAVWIKQVLQNNETAYPPGLNENPGWIIISTVAHATADDRVVQKIGKGIEYLTNEVQWDNVDADNAEYTASLLYAIGCLKNQSLYPLLVKLADKETVKPVTLPDGHHLHGVVLASLGSFDCNEDTVHIFERDIGNVEYAALCYRMLWKFDPFYASEHADSIYLMGKQHSKFPAEELLREAGIK